MVRYSFRTVWAGCTKTQKSILKVEDRTRHMRTNKRKVDSRDDFDIDLDVKMESDGCSKIVFGQSVRVGVQGLKKIVSSLMALVLVVIGGRPKKARFANAKESIDILTHSEKSLIRFGDGEFGIMNNHGIHYQDVDERLAEELKKIILEYSATDSAYYLAMPGKYFSCFWTFYIKHWNKMKYFLYSRWVFIAKYDFDELYLDAFLFARGYSTMFPNIWKRDDLKGLILIHNNPVYAKILSGSVDIPVEFIKIPPSNAYSVIDDLMADVVKRYQPGILILISAGPCGKVMTYRLSKIGIRCIDTGHCFDDPLEVL